MLWTKKEADEQTTIKEYWQATDAVSRPMAVVMTLLIIFIFLAVSFSLIMGGRWLYHNLAGNNDKPATVTTTEEGITDVGESGSSTTNKAGGATTTPAPSSSPKSTTKPTPTPVSTSNGPDESAIPGTGPSELPSTGPGPE